MYTIKFTGVALMGWKHAQSINYFEIFKYDFIVETYLPVLKLIFTAKNFAILQLD